MKPHNFYQVVAVLLLISTMHAVLIDLTKTNKDGVALSTALCNQQTLINIRFNSASVLSSCTSAGCSTVINLSFRLL